MPANTIAVANDHAAYELKFALSEILTGMGYTVLDLGTGGPDSVDYPDFARALAKVLKEGKADRGLLLCGSGIGISIAANRYAHVRAALVHDAYGARMCRQHNDANVLCMGARTTGPDVASDCLKVFLDTAFDGGRHAPRVDMLTNPKPVA